MDSIHSGHRKRLKERCLKYGFDSLQDHEKLELFLFNVIPRKDTNPIAHQLLKKFGNNFAKVFEADIEELKMVDGIGDNAAFFINLMSSFVTEYMRATVKRGEHLSTTEKLEEFVGKLFVGKTEEELIIIYLDSNRCLKKFEVVEKGVVNEVLLYPRKIVERALTAKAVNIVLAHNHPNGNYFPSQADIDATINLEDAMFGLNINIIDHIIYAAGRCYSMKTMNHF